MRVYESADYDWQKPELFSFWQWVEPESVRSIALQLLVEFYKPHAAPVLYPNSRVVEEDGETPVPWHDRKPSDYYVQGIRDGLNACAASATLWETAPRVAENEESSRRYR